MNRRVALKNDVVAEDFGELDFGKPGGGEQQEGQTGGDLRWILHSHIPQAEAECICELVCFANGAQCGIDSAEVLVGFVISLSGCGIGLEAFCDLERLFASCIGVGPCADSDAGEQG